MIGGAWLAAAMAAGHLADASRERYAMERMTPEGFKAWQAERTAERRHQEVCAAIKQAGENARPRRYGAGW